MKKIKVLFTLVMVLAIMSCLTLVTVHAEPDGAVTDVVTSGDLATGDADADTTLAADSDTAVDSDSAADSDAETTPESDSTDDTSADTTTADTTAAADTTTIDPHAGHNHAEEESSATWDDLGTSGIIAIVVAVVIAVAFVTALVLFVPKKSKMRK